MRNHRSLFNLILNSFTLFIAFIIPSGYILAQNEEKKDFISYKYELSLEGIQLTKNEKQNINIPYDFEDYYKFPLGVGIKLNGKDGAFRLKLFYNYNSKKELDDSGDDKIKRSYYNSKTSFGYELHKNFRRTQFFYGIDLIRTNYKIKEKDYSLYIPKKQQKYSKVCWGLSPLIGGKYFVTPHLSLSTEVSIILEQFNEEYTEMETESKGFNLNIAPVGLISVNIHL